MMACMSDLAEVKIADVWRSRRDAIRLCVVQALPVIALSNGAKGWSWT